MVFMQFKCHALGCAPRSHFSIALHWIRSIIAVGVDGDNMVSSLAEFSDGLLKGLQRVPINSEETTTCFTVLLLNGGEVVVDEAHPSVELRQPVEDVLVETEKTNDGMTGLARSSQPFVVLKAKVPSVPEKRNVRHMEWG